MIERKEDILERPPVSPRSWNKSVPLYAGMWKERSGSSILLKVWTGSCWSWVKVRTLGRDLPKGYAMESPVLVRRGQQWWLHTPIEKTFTAPPKIAEQITKTDTKICSVDLNLNEQLAVCTVQTVEGTILATRFIGGGREIAGFRKRLLGRIARNRSQTGTIAEHEQDNADLWRKIRNVDEQITYLVSARIVQFACEQGATILVFEHLESLKPEKGKYSRRGNSKRAFWMKGRIFKYAKYKAWNEHIITSRVNPRNTSRECHRCHALIIRYAQGQPVSGYSPGTPLCLCPECAMRGNSDRNASLVVGQRLITRYQEPFKAHGMRNEMTTRKYEGVRWHFEKAGGEEGRNTKKRYCKEKRQKDILKKRQRRRQEMKVAVLKGNESKRAQKSCFNCYLYSLATPKSISRRLCSRTPIETNGLSKSNRQSVDRDLKWESGRKAGIAGHSLLPTQTVMCPLCSRLHIRVLSFLLLLQLFEFH